ncbi:MAG: hypothetical protein EOO38_07380 [Cytophagaceae bacterium]|nr:MAG: hypothetical protein EOO38_07380 [Cytophagaceae bacterium]
MIRFLTATALVSSLSLFPAYVQAQNAGSPAAGASDASATDAQVSTAVGSDPTVVDKTPPGGGSNDIVVTGSRIRRPNLESTVPIASIRSQDIYSRADPNAGEALNDLPALYRNVMFQMGLSVYLPLFVGQVVRAIWTKQVEWAAAKLKLGKVGSVCLLLLVW